MRTQSILTLLSLFLNISLYLGQATALPTNHQVGRPATPTKPNSLVSNTINYVKGVLGFRSCEELKDERIQKANKALEDLMKAEGELRALQKRHKDEKAKWGKERQRQRQQDDGSAAAKAAADEKSKHKVEITALQEARLLLQTALDFLNNAPEHCKSGQDRTEYEVKVKALQINLEKLNKKADALGLVG